MSLSRRSPSARRRPVPRPGARAASAVVEQLEGRTLMAASDLDLSWDTDGKLIYDGGSGSGFTDVAVQPDGKVLAVGQSADTMNGRVYGLFRFNVDGTPDTTFSGDGVAPLPFGMTADVDHFELALMGDGRIVVAGTVDTTPTANVGIARFTSTGALDTGFRTGFNQNGYVFHPLPGGGTGGIDLAVQADGKILLGTGEWRSPTVARFLATTGALDTTFGSGGYATITLGEAAYLTDIAVLPSGKTLVSGMDTTGDAFVARLTSAGVYDSTFAGGTGLAQNVIDNGWG